MCSVIFKKPESFGGDKQWELLSQSFEKDSFPRNFSTIPPCLAAGLLWEMISGAGWAALTHIYHQQFEFWGESEIAKETNQPIEIFHEK